MAARNARTSAKSSPFKEVALVAAVLSALSLLVFLSVFAASKQPGDIFVPLIAFLASFLALLVVFLTALFSRSRVVNTLVWRVAQREGLLRLILTIGFGVLFTGAINVATITFAHSQLSLTNHSTFPALELEAAPINGQDEYRLSSPIGSASHVSLSVNYRCYFRYDNTPCMLEIKYPTSISSGTGSIDFETREIAFRPDCDLIDPEKAGAIAIDYIGSKIPSADFIHVERCFEVAFFDFQNQRATYHFSEQDDRIVLAQTTSHYVYDNNCGSSIFSAWEFEDTMKHCLDGLLTKFVPAEK